MLINNYLKLKKMMSVLVVFLCIQIGCSGQTLINYDLQLNQTQNLTAIKLPIPPKIKSYQLSVIRNVRHDVNITHNHIKDQHNSLNLYWGRNESQDLYLEAKDYFEDRKSRPFYYKLRKNDQQQWKVKNVTSSISRKKIERIAGRNNANDESSVNKKYRMKILPDGSHRLIVSDAKREQNINIFRTSVIDTDISFRDFIYVDSENNILTFCGLNDDIRSSLLMVNFIPRSPRRAQFNFSISLMNVLCIDPKTNFPDTYLSSNLKEPLLDIERIVNTRGVIIASQMQHKLSIEEARMLDVYHLRTMITFNHGQEWTVLKLQNDCQTGLSEPFLYLDQSFSRLHFDQSHLGILEGLETSPGIILATGHLAYLDNPSDTFPGVFTSHDGGISWKKVFHERLMLSLSNPKWEIILAVRNCLGGFTKRIYLSNDLGLNWKLHDIFNQEVCVHKVVSGGWGAKSSSVFVLLSTKPDYEGWIVTVIDFHDLAVVHKTCKKTEVELWPPKNSQHFCVHGRKILRYRRKSKRLCDSSTIENSQTKFTHNCTCSSFDLYCRNSMECPTLSRKLLSDFKKIYMNSKSLEVNQYSNSLETEKLSENSLTMNIISNDRYYNFLKSIGYVKPRYNFCYVTKSVFERKFKKVCGVNSEKRFYFSRANTSSFSIEFSLFYISVSILMLYVSNKPLTV